MQAGSVGAPQALAEPGTGTPLQITGRETKDGWVRFTTRRPDGVEGELKARMIDEVEVW